jgi:hypothetical protein
MKTRKHTILPLAALALAITSANAATIFVDEHSFEGAKDIGLTTPGGFLGQVPTPWVRTGSHGTQWFTGPPPMPSNAAKMRPQTKSNFLL